MTRRGALLSFLSTLQTTAIGSFSLGLLTGTYRVVIVNHTKNSQASAQTVNEFWDLHRDTFAEELNNTFQSDGRLLRVDSYLRNNGKTAVLVKIYRSKKDHLDYIQQLNEHHQSIAYNKKVHSKAVIV